VLPIPVVRQLANRLELHRLRSGSPLAGPIFANVVGKPLSLGSVVNRVILSALNRCGACGSLKRTTIQQTTSSSVTLASQSGTVGTRHDAAWEATSTVSVYQIW